MTALVTYAVLGCLGLTVPPEWSLSRDAKSLTLSSPQFRGAVRLRLLDLPSLEAARDQLIADQGAGKVQSASTRVANAPAYRIEARRMRGVVVQLGGRMHAVDASWPEGDKEIPPVVDQVFASLHAEGCK